MINSVLYSDPLVSMETNSRTPEDAQITVFNNGHRLQLIFLFEIKSPVAQVGLRPGV